MKISKTLATKFPEMTLDAVFIAGTVDAYEHGIEEDAHCVVCGSPIKYCFSTQYGIVGGDCLATLTGDDSTRKAVKSIINQMERSWLSPYKLVVKKANTWKNEYLIFCNGYYEDSGNQYDRFFAGPGSLMAVRCAVSLYAEKHNIKSVEEV